MRADVAEPRAIRLHFYSWSCTRQRCSSQRHRTAMHMQLTASDPGSSPIIFDFGFGYVFLKSISISAADRYPDPKV
jgi:hypothetical protein